jgi:outer membrane protein TolC
VFVLAAVVLTAQAAPGERDLTDLRNRIDALTRELAAKEAERNEARDALRESERAISETNRALMALQNETRELQAQSARLGAERARSVLQLTTEAYRAGATNDLDVTTAQQQSRDADLAAVIAEDGVRQARLDLLSAIGQFP